MKVGEAYSRGGLERFVAKRVGATTMEIASSHVPMLFNPNFVIDVIRAAAKSCDVVTTRSVIVSGRAGISPRAS